MWRGETATCRYAAINYEDSICHASDSASPPCTTFSSPGLTGRRQRSAFLVRNPARCLRRYWHRWSWHPRRSVHLEKHSVADPVIEACSPAEQNRLKGEAAKLAEVFQRSSSNV